MQAQKANWIQICTFIGAILIILGGLYAYSNLISEDDVKTIVAGEVGKIEIPEAPVVSVPTAKEIAAEISLPEIPDTSKEVIEGIYDDEVDDLEEDCIDALEDEYEDDALDEIRDLIEDKIGDDIDDLEIEDWNYRNDYDFDVIDLGLDDEEDRAGELSVVFRVSYEEVFGDEDTQYDKVYVTGKCSDWDERDNEFDNLVVKYSL